MLQGIGLVIVTLGIIGFIWGVLQKLKAGRVADAPLATTGDVVQRGKAVAGPKGQISAQGGVVCQQPLIAPFSGTPCLYYRLKCTAEWKDGDTNKSKVLDEQKVAAKFSIDDGSGAVWIDAHEGGDFEPTQTKRETKGTGLLGGITGTEITFGNYRVQTGMLSMGTKYSVEEEILPVVPRLYACGKVSDQGGTIGSPSWRQLILSSKSRDELLSAATKGAKMFLAGGAAVFVVGSGLAITGQLLGGGDAKAAPPVASVAAKEAAPAVTSVTAPVDSAESTPPTVAAVATAKTTSAPAKATTTTTASAKPAVKPDAGAPAKAAASGAPSAKK
ncbi:MAG: Sporulation domain protein [Labilithrix sp.]|nr:Sporulation domain protein [Labilithrix sp.]